MFKKQHPEVGSKPGVLVIAADAQPPVIRVVDYDLEHHEVLEDVSIEECRRRAATPSVSWIDLRGLGDHEVLHSLATALEIHPLALEDAVNVPVRPKSEIYRNFHLIVLRSIRARDDGRHERSQVTLFVGHTALLSMQEVHADVFERVRKRTEVGPRMRANGPDYLAYALIDFVIDSYYPAIEAISRQLEELEEEITLNARRGQIRRILALRAELQELRRDVEPMREVVATLLREESPFFGEEVRPFLRDCHDHATQIADVIQSDLDSTSQLLGLHGAMMGNRMNEIMKVLTVMSTIFIPLSFLAGIYGMNFVNIPELQKENGYFVLLGVMALIVVGLLGFFARKGWLRDD